MGYFPQSFCVQLRAFLTCPAPCIGNNLCDYSCALCSPYLNPNELLGSLTACGSWDGLSGTGKPQPEHPPPAKMSSHTHRCLGRVGLSLLEPLLRSWGVAGPDLGSGGRVSAASPAWVLFSAGDITMEGLDKDRQLQTGEIIIIVAVLLMWAGECHGQCPGGLGQRCSPGSMKRMGLESVQRHVGVGLASFPVSPLSLCRSLSQWDKRSNHSQCQQWWPGVCGVAVLGEQGTVCDSGNTDLPVGASQLTLTVLTWAFAGSSDMG